MIKNNRQYLLTKKQFETFSSSLEEIKRNPPRHELLDPLFQEIQAEAIKSQMADLQADLMEYEELISGKIKTFECDSLAKLPLLLIKARISQGLSQKDLADKLGMKEQQVQRYEANDYESASLSRLLEVSDALGLRFTQKVELPVKVDILPLVERAAQTGLTKDFIIKRLLPHDIRNKLKAEVFEPDQSFSAAKVMEVLSRVFKWSTSEIFGVGQLTINPELAPCFKMPKKADADFAKAYTAYAHYLALMTADLASDIPAQEISSNPICIREQFFDLAPVITLKDFLNFIWNMGIPVLPLNDSGAFHGACWRINGRNVIAIKQKSPYESRWIFDLAHELYHASQESSDASRCVVDVFEDYPNYKESEEEVSAYNFAGVFTIGPNADELVRECIEEASGKIEFLQSNVIKVAKKHNIDVGLLANFLAFRLTLQGINWWGTATNLQSENGNPWTTARDVFLERVDLSRLNDVDREIIISALT